MSPGRSLLFCPTPIRLMPSSGRRCPPSYPHGRWSPLTEQGQSKVITFFSLRSPFPLEKATEGKFKFAGAFTWFFLYIISPFNPDGADRRDPPDPCTGRIS